MIVRNEASQLAACLDSVANLFDEIVIVDTGSTDETRTIARRYTQHVHDFAWNDDFSAARNEALRLSSGEWIFWLDADDRLSAENAVRLKDVLGGLDGQPSVYLLDTICRTASCNELERVITHPRLFKRHPVLSWRRRVHEQLHPWPGSLGYEVKFCDVVIDHLGYQKTDILQRKRHRNLRLLRMEYAVNPDDLDTLLDLGTAYTKRGSFAQARRFFEDYLRVAPRYSAERQRVFVSLAELAMQEGRFQEAIEVTQQGLAILKDDEHLAYLQAEACYQLGNCRKAEAILTQIIHAPERERRLLNGQPCDIQQRLAPLALGEVLRMQRAYAAAEIVLRNLAERTGNDGVPWQFLGRVYVDTGEQGKFEGVLERLTHCDRGELFAKTLRISWEMLRGDVESAQRLATEVIALVPEMPLPRQLLAQCLERRGVPTTDLQRAYRDVLRVQPGNPTALAAIQRLERGQTWLERVPRRTNEDGRQDEYGRTVYFVANSTVSTANV